MKLFKSGNFYQKENWEMVELTRQVREDESRKTPEEREADAMAATAELDKIMEKYTVMMSSRRYIRLPFVQWLFRRAANMAVEVAEHFKMNVKVEADEDKGSIWFETDQVISDRIWQDQNYRNKLLRLMRWADSMWIDTKESPTGTLVQIDLTYKLSIIFNVKSRK